MSLAVAVLVLVAAWFVLLPVRSSVTSDDGAYAVHVVALEERGSWSVPHVLAEVDPAGVTYPYQNFSVSDEGFFPAARHAVWIRVLDGANAVGGVAGMRVVPALGLVLAVAASVALSGLLHPAAGRWLPGALACLSPLAFNGLQLWAHAVVAGFIGLALVALTRLAERPTFTWTAAGMIGVAVASGLRADGFIFAVAVVGVLLLSGLRQRSVPVLASGAATGLAAIASFLLSAAYADSFVGSAAGAGVTSNRAAGSGIAGRLGGAVQTFVTSGDSPAALVLAVAALGFVGYAVLQVRRGDGRAATALLVLATVLWVVRTSLEPRSEATGLVAAWPVLLLGAIRPWSTLGRGDRRLLGVVGIAAIGVLVTQYDEGGGLNWGGRFLAPAIPALAVLAAAGLRHARVRLAEADFRRWCVAAGSLIAVTFAASLVFDAAGRLRHEELIARVEGVTEVPVVTSVDPLPRLAWRTYPEVQWLRVPTDEAGGVRALIDDLRTAGVEQVALFGVSPEDAKALAGRRTRIDTSEPVIVDVTGER